MSENDNGFDAVFGSGRGSTQTLPAMAGNAHSRRRRRRRYGRLRLRSYDPRTHVLVRPQRLHLEFPARTDLAAARHRLRAAAGELAVAWVIPPHSWNWKCGCGGDALSGLIPCDAHMSSDGDTAPYGGVSVEGVWVPVDRHLLPVYASHKRSYPVLRTLVPAAAYAHTCVVTP